MCCVSGLRMYAALALLCLSIHVPLSLLGRGCIILSLILSPHGVSQAIQGMYTSFQPCAMQCDSLYSLYVTSMLHYCQVLIWCKSLCKKERRLHADTACSRLSLVVPAVVNLRLLIAYLKEPVPLRIDANQVVSIRFGGYGGILHCIFNHHSGFCKAQRILIHHKVHSAAFQTKV